MKTDIPSAPQQGATKRFLIVTASTLSDLEYKVDGLLAEGTYGVVGGICFAAHERRLPEYTQAMIRIEPPGITHSIQCSTIQAGSIVLPSRAGARFQNYAGDPTERDLDTRVAAELEMAGIAIERFPEMMRKSRGEVKTIVMGSLHGWGFTRAWYYWVCTGPGIPVYAAEWMHARRGSEVRVDGHAGCPGPTERFHGLGCGAYHVDTQEGLLLLANVIKRVVRQEGQPTKWWPEAESDPIPQ